MAAIVCAMVIFWEELEEVMGLRVVVAALFAAVACSSISPPDGSGSPGALPADAGAGTGNTDGGSGGASDGGSSSGSADAGNPDGGGGAEVADGGGGGSGSGGSGSGSGGGGSNGGGGSSGGSGSSGGGGGGSGGGADSGAAAAPARLTTGERGVAIAADSSRVYWVSQVFADHPGDDQLTVRALSRDGGDAVTLSTARGTSSFRLRADADSLYIQARRCTSDSFRPCATAMGARDVIYRFPKAGGPPFEFKNDRARILLAVDDDWLYASHLGDEFEPGSVDQVAKDGSSSTPIKGQGASVAMVTTASDLYWTQSGSKIAHMPRGGSPSTISDSNVAFARDLALDGDFLFLRGLSLGNSADMNLYTVPRSGGDLSLLWRTPGTVSSVVAADRGHVFWNQDPDPVDGFKGCLGRANANGTQGGCIDGGLYHYGPIAVNGSDVFYLRNGDVFRAGTAAPEDQDGTDGEWMEQGDAVPPAPGGTVSGAATLVDGTERIEALAIDGDTVYWITSPETGRDFQLHAIPKAGGVPVILARLAGAHGGGDLDPGLIADGEWSFFNLYCGVDLGCWSGARRLSKKGGAVEWLGALDRFAVDGDSIYFTRLYHGGDLEVVRRDGTGHRVLYAAAKGDVMTVWGGQLYWWQPAAASQDKATLYRAPADGSGSPVAVGTDSGGAGIHRLRADAANVYWFWGSQIHRMPRAGGTPVTMGNARDFDIQAGRVYFSEWQPDGGPPACLAAVDADGSNYKCLDRSSEWHGAVRVDATSAFFVRGGTKILRVDR